MWLFFYPYLKRKTGAYGDNVGASDNDNTSATAVVGEDGDVDKVDGVNIKRRKKKS